MDEIRARHARLVRLQLTLQRLERRAWAQLLLRQAQLQQYRSERWDVIAHLARAREATFLRPSIDGFACITLAAYSARSAVLASGLSDSQLRSREAIGKLGVERLYWMRCQRGLARRARKGIKERC